MWLLLALDGESFTPVKFAVTCVVVVADVSGCNFAVDNVVMGDNVDVDVDINDDDDDVDNVVIVVVAVDD